jgi:hypothetical protein
LWPHAPQFIVSLVSSTHAPPHNARPAVVQWHWPALHWVAEGHAYEMPLVLHAPQLLLSVMRLAQLPLQSVWPAGHTQALL